MLKLFNAVTTKDTKTVICVLETLQSGHIL